MEKLKSYLFWVGLVASIMIVVKFVAESFGFTIPEENIDSIVNGVLGILTVMGVVNKPVKSQDNNNATVDIEELDIDNDEI